MSFDVSNAVDDFANWLLKNKTLKAIAQSTILTVCLISVLCMIIVYFVFQDSLRTFRAGFWIFFINMMVLTLHQRLLRDSTVGNYEPFEPVKIGPITVESII